MSSDFDCYNREHRFVKSAFQSEVLNMPRLPLFRYELTFRAREHITLPPFQGKLWRGVFGAALKKLSDSAALDGNDDAAQVYSYFFDTPKPHEGSAPFGKDAPLPYVIAAEVNAEPWRLAPGQPILLELTLIGRGNDAASMVFDAFAEAANTGLGKSRGRAELIRVGMLSAPSDLVGAAGNHSEIPDAPEFVEVRLTSPMRIVRDHRVVGPEAFRAEHLLITLVHRIANLVTLHTEEEWRPDFARLKELAKRALVRDQRLTFLDLMRWSSKQQKETPIGGLVGSLVLDMRGMEPLWPYLWLGQQVHAGKGTVMGLGAIRLSEANN